MVTKYGIHGVLIVPKRNLFTGLCAAIRGTVSAPSTSTSSSMLFQLTTLQWLAKGSPTHNPKKLYWRQYLA